MVALFQAVQIVLVVSIATLVIGLVWKGYRRVRWKRILSKSVELSIPCSARAEIVIPRTTYVKAIAILFPVSSGLFAGKVQFFRDEPILTIMVPHRKELFLGAFRNNQVFRASRSIEVDVCKVIQPGPVHVSVDLESNLVKLGTKGRVDFSDEIEFEIIVFGELM